MMAKAITSTTKKSSTSARKLALIQAVDRHVALDDFANNHSLDFDEAEKLHQYFVGRTRPAFGIGTFCSNDTCEEALNIVIKLQYVNGRPVAKLSDFAEKTMCSDPEYLTYLKRSVEFRLDREQDKLVK